MCACRREWVLWGHGICKVGVLGRATLHYVFPEVRQRHRHRGECRLWDGQGWLLERQRRVDSQPVSQLQPPPSNIRTRVLARRACTCTARRAVAFCACIAHHARLIVRCAVAPRAWIVRARHRLSTQPASANRAVVPRTWIVRARPAAVGARCGRCWISRAQPEWSAQLITLHRAVAARAFIASCHRSQE